MSINEKARQIVDNHVRACITDFAEHLFGHEGGKYADFDQWDNMHVITCPECGGINRIEWDDEDEHQPYTCRECGSRFDEMPEEEEQEIYEYWIVSSWLGEKLRAAGEPVLERAYLGWIWGRACTGQAIYLDSVIRKIAMS